MNHLGSFSLLFLDVFFAHICFYISHHTLRPVFLFFEEKGAGILMLLPSRRPHTPFNFSLIPARLLPDTLVALQLYAVVPL
ncbi:hypothetical protein EDB89DRAFT_1983145 [Lactarius sanguifluus]|nr:hypothetical protein EDB89DRAFT_1983145 [Lactarius sanguifluus]